MTTTMLLLLLLPLLPRRCKGLVFLHAPPANGASLSLSSVLSYTPLVSLVVSLLVLAIVDRIRNLGTKGAVQFFLRLAPFFDPLGGAIPSRL